MPGIIRLSVVALVASGLCLLPQLAEAAFRTVHLDAAGRLLKPLPQVDAGDRVRFVVEPTLDSPQLDRASFELVWSCGAGDGYAEERLVLHPTPTTFEGVLPLRCTATTPNEVRWDLEARRAEDLLAQRYLHEAARNLSWLNRTALLCLGRGDCTTAGTRAFRASRDADVQRRIEDTDALFTAVSRRQASDPARVAFEAVFAVPDSGQPLGPAVAGAVAEGEGSGWEALAAASAGAFGPYSDALQSEAGTFLKAVDEALNLVDSLTSAGGFASAPEAAGIIRLIEQVGGPTVTPDTPLETVRQLLLDGRGHIVARVESKYLKPSVWLSTGELPIGFHQRVVTIDVDGDADTPELPLNRLDRVWVALANATDEEWRVSVTTPPAPEAELAQLYPDAALATRGGGLTLVAPPVRLRTARPLRRVILRDYGKQPGHTNLVFSATSSDGAKTKTTRPFYVRRTWNIGFKTALVYSHIRDRQLDFLRDPNDRLIFQNGLPRTTSTQADGQAEVVLGVAIHPYPMDLQDEARRPIWARFLPHLFVGWAPTDFARLYGGGGFEPIKGISISGGVALGPRSVLRAPPLGYGTGWDVIERPSLGWWVGIAADASLVARLFERKNSAPTVNFGSFLSGGLLGGGN